MMKQVAVNMFQASDEQRFETAREAITHERFLAVNGLFSDMNIPYAVKVHRFDLMQEIANHYDRWMKVFLNHTYGAQFDIGKQFEAALSQFMITNENNEIKIDATTPDKQSAIVNAILSVIEKNDLFEHPPEDPAKLEEIEVVKS